MTDAMFHDLRYDVMHERDLRDARAVAVAVAAAFLIGFSVVWTLL